MPPAASVKFRPGWVPTPHARPRVTLDGAVKPLYDPPASVDFYSNLPSVGMLLNDDWGDCTIASDGHIVEGLTFFGSGLEFVVSDSAALAAYEVVGRFDPNAGPPGNNPTDNGAQIADALQFLKVTGFGGHKIAGYGQVSPSDHQKVQVCSAEFGYLSVGLNLPQSAEDQFNSDGPTTWTVVPGSSVVGGHCVCMCGYTPQGPVAWTWGASVQLTWDFWDAYVVEAWPVVSADWVSRASAGKDPEGVSLAVLGQEFEAVIGQNPFPPAPSVLPSSSGGCLPFGRAVKALKSLRLQSW